MPRRLGIGTGLTRIPSPTGGGGGGGITPKAPDEVAQLSTWFDPADLTAYTLNGVAVRELRSQVGGTFPLSYPGSDTSAPSIVWLGDKTALSFDGGNDYLLCNQKLAPEHVVGSDDFTVMAVIRTVNPDFAPLVNFGAIDGRYSLRIQPAGEVGFFIGPDTGATARTATAAGQGIANDGLVHVVTGQRVNSEDNLKVYLDGELIATETQNGVGSLDPSSTAGRIQNLLINVSPAGAGVTNYHQSIHGDVVIFKGTVSDADRRAVEEFLLQKYRPVPLQISDISFWLDATNSGTIDATSGVAVWVSQIGSEVVMEQTTTNARPSLITEGDLSWIRFATNDYLTSGGGSEAEEAINFGADEFTITTVVRTSSVVLDLSVLNKGNSGRYLLRINDTAAGSVAPFISDGTDVAFAQGSGDVSVNDGNPHVLTMIRDNVANLLRIRLDGVEVDTVDCSAVGDIDDTSATAQEGKLLLGATANGAALVGYYNGDIGEVIFYKKKLDAEELSLIEDHLSTKWGVA
jgi:hypothetical protein